MLEVSSLVRTSIDEPVLKSVKENEKGKRWFASNMIVVLGSKTYLGFVRNK